MTAIEPDQPEPALVLPTKRKKYKHQCSACGESRPGGDGLFRKKIMFQEMGSTDRVVKSRNVSWLCESCMTSDPDFAASTNDGPGITQMLTNREETLDDEPAVDQ